MSQLVVIGAGQAGGHAAVAARRAGFAGRILLVGEEPVLPYERPPLSKEHLLAPDPLPPPYLMKAERYAEHAVEPLLDVAATAIDVAARQVTLASGAALPFDRLVIATGGRARRLAIPGAEHVLTLRRWSDAAVLRQRLMAARRVVCIGAGVIGLEIASSAAALGREVTVLEATDSVMGRCLAPPEADFVQSLHREAGIRFVFGGAVAAVAPAGGAAAFEAVLVDGRVLPADLLVAGIGLERNTALAVAAGLPVEGGILVDAFAETAVPGVFAAGDVTAFWHPRYERRMRLESWHHAQDHGIAAGRAAAGERQPYDAVPRFWTTQHGVDIQVVGLPAEGRERVLRGAVADRRFTALHLDAEGRVVGATIVNNAREIRPAMALIRSGARPPGSALASVPLQQLMATSAP